MNISRRNFLGKSLKAMAVAALASVIVPLIKTKSITANPVPTVEDKGEVIQFRKWINCDDYLQQIKIIDYVPGMKIPYESPVTPVCIECAFYNKCTATGKGFAQVSQKFVPEVRNRKAMQRWYKECKFSEYVT